MIVSVRGGLLSGSDTIVEFRDFDCLPYALDGLDPTIHLEMHALLTRDGAINEGR